jgi:hypothetical protein
MKNAEDIGLEDFSGLAVWRVRALERLLIFQIEPAKVVTTSLFIPTLTNAEKNYWMR